VRVVAISCVKNEGDLVEAFIRHTAAVADHLIVLDNGSTDGTRDILSALQRRGLPLDVVDDPSIGQWQWKRMTRLMHTAALDCGADWVLPLDADEFFVAAPGGGVFANGADDVPAEALLHVFWRTYVPRAGDDLSEINPVRRIRHRLVKEGHPWVKVVIPGTLARLPAATLAQGSHALVVDGSSCLSRQCERAYLAHFPVRSPGQYAAKVAIHRLQYFAMTERDPSWGFHYADPFELLKKDPECFATDFREAAARYALTPDEMAVEPRIIEDSVEYLGDPIEYTPPCNDGARPLTALLPYSESLARHHASLRAEVDAQRAWRSGAEAAVVSLEASLEEIRQSRRYRLGDFLARTWWLATHSRSAVAWISQRVGSRSQPPTPG
jgi:hypothetical protein